MAYTLVMLNSAGSIVVALAAAALGTALLVGLVYVVFSGSRLRRWRMPATFVSPGVIGITALLGFPLVFSLYLAGTNMSIQHVLDFSFSLSHYVENFRWVLFEADYGNTLGVLITRTGVWTIIQIVLRLVIGFMLALALTQPIRFRGVFKFLLLLPWAMPGIILILSLRGEFHYTFGFVNLMLEHLAGFKINWYGDSFWNMVAIHLVGLYLSIPYFMLIVEGALRSMPRYYLEAAELDGAGPVRRLFSITIPMTAPVLWPPVLFSILYLFNEFNIPWLLNKQSLETSEFIATGILNLAFTYGQYARSAAAGWGFMLFMLVLSGFMVRIGGLLPKEVKE